VGWSFGHSAASQLGELEPRALEALTDNESGLFEEFHSLCLAGFSFDEISIMLGEESYQAAIAAIEKADREYKQLIAEARRKPVRSLNDIAQ
jgi:hypothetical protein